MREQVAEAKATVEDEKLSKKEVTFGDFDLIYMYALFLNGDTPHARA